MSIDYGDASTLDLDSESSPPGEQPPPRPAPLTPIPLPPAPAPFDPQASLGQLLQVLQHYAAAGMIQQRPDGSYMLPGQSDTRWEERLRVGSACACAACTPHNQRHWLCMICNSPHEWVMVNDRPRVMQTRLGAGGVAGYTHLVCSNECALEYRRRLGLGSDTVSAMGQERPIPVAGGVEDPHNFFLGA